MVDVGSARTRASVLLACLAAPAGFLGMVTPSALAASRHEHPSRVFAGAPRAASSGQRVGESVLRTAHASRSSAPTHAGAKVPWLSRADSNTYVAGSGHLVAHIYPFPINYRTRAGKWTAINPALRATGSGYAQRANDLGVRLPKAAGGTAQVSDHAGGLSLTLAGASGTGRLAGRVERFFGVRAGVDLAYRSQTSGIGWQAQLSPAAAARGLRWAVRATKGLSAKLVSGGVAFRTAKGRAAWVFHAPAAYVAGSQKPMATRITLSRSRGEVLIHVAAASPRARRVPAVFSPLAVAQVEATAAAVPTSNQIVWSGQVVPGSKAFLNYAEQTGNCYVDSGSPDSSFCGSSTGFVGPSDHLLINFDVADNLPSHVQILQSFVGMQVSSESGTTAENIGVWQAAQPWTNFASWNSYDGTNNWNTPGGDTTGAMNDVNSVGASGDVGKDFYWNITPAMQGWVDGNPSQVDGLLFAATDGSSAPNTLGFVTDSSGDAPYMSVSYEPRLGDYPNAKYDTQQLTNRSSEGVNVATGNLLLSNTDLNLTGVDGLNLNIGRYYNNLSGDQGSFGVGWSMGTGADTFLEVPSDNQGTVDYFDGTGSAQTFQFTPSNEATPTAPPGLDAKLSMNVHGDVYDSTTFTLLFRHSGITETFTKPAATLNVIARLQTLTDRHGNTITYHYNSSNQLTSITDSYGNTTTISWSTAGYVSQITDPTGRVYQYFQNSSGQLTRYEDPAGNSTDYSYDSYGNLTQITTPAGNIINVGYDAGNTNQVTSVERLVHPTDTTGPTTTYQIATASGTCPANAGWTQDTVSDPNRHTTTYCADDLSRLTGVIDANGHSRTTSYSPAGYVSQQMTPSGIPTTFSYSTDGNDNVTQIQQGSSGGSTSPVTEGLSYSDATNPYLPTQSTDPQGNTLNNTYNSSGSLTNVKDPSSGAQATLTYNSDGTVATSTDANNNETTYSYTGHDLTTVTPPSVPAPMIGQNPILITYDSANRVSEISTISGTTGHEVEYTYNDFDEVTKAVYKNAALATVETINYTYDPDGNLTNMSDSAGATAYTYDGLDRLTHVQYPASGSWVSYGYDPASNLTTLTDPSGTVTYAYDKADQLTSTTDPGQSKPSASLTYSNDGLLTSITYPSGASVANAYNSIDQLLKTTDTYKNTSGQIAHLSNAYTYTGSLQKTSTDQAGNVTTYTYDTLNRLTEAQTKNTSGTTTANYAYTLDPNGNITQQAITGSSLTASTTSYAYNADNEICWAVNSSTSNACGSAPSGANSYSYDVSGNEISNGAGLTMTYNALDQMTSATSGSTTSNYSYLGAGQTQLVADGATTLQNSQLGLESSTNSGNTTYYTLATNGRPLDERTEAGTYDYLYDGQGNVIGLVNSSGQMVSQYSYDPYGNQTTIASTVANPFGYRAGYTTSTGQVHFGARYLQAAQGSWTQEDPLNQITNLTQNDRYIYAGDNPINIADPTGEFFDGSVRSSV